MSRFAIACSVEDLKRHLVDEFKKCAHHEWAEEISYDYDPLIVDHGYTYVELCHASRKIDKDLKVEFDFENYDCFGESYNSSLKKIIGFHTLNNGFSFLGISAGGDWESPVFFILYWDGTSIRAYIPKDGNTYNEKEMSAYGNNDEDPEGFDFDCDKILTDIQNRIIVKNSTSVSANPFELRATIVVSKKVNTWNHQIENDMELEIKKFLLNLGYKIDSLYFGTEEIED